MKGRRTRLSKKELYETILGYGGFVDESSEELKLKDFLDDYKDILEIKDLQLKLYKMKNRIESGIGLTWDEHERLVKRHRNYSSKLKELRRTKREL